MRAKNFTFICCLVLIFPTVSIADDSTDIKPQSETKNHKDINTYGGDIYTEGGDIDFENGELKNVFQGEITSIISRYLQAPSTSTGWPYIIVNSPLSLQGNGISSVSRIRVDKTIPTQSDEVASKRYVDQKAGSGRVVKSTSKKSNCPSGTRSLYVGDRRYGSHSGPKYESYYICITK